jgi:hypothetical protein
MSKVGGGSSDQQTKTDPWDGLKPYLIGLDGKTGIMPEAERLYKEATPEYFKGNSYAGLNDVQNGAIGKLLDYYSSPSSMAGANAATKLGGELQNKDAMTFNGVSAFNSLPQLAKENQITAPTVAPTAPIQAASVGSSGVDWKTAIQNTLKGEVNNPYLSEISGNIGRSASDNYLRNIAPQISGGAQLAGQFGGSRHGVVEANALRDLNRGVSDSVANLYGSAYENAQNAKNSSALALSGQESGERVSQAQLAQQAALAQAQIQAQQAMQQAQLDYQAQRDNQQGALSLGDLAIRDKIGTGNLNLNAGGLNLNADNQNFNQQLAGVGLLQQGSQQPITNAQGVLGIGALQQQNAQGQINADMDRWNFNQTLPWQNLQNYAGLVTGAGGRYGEGSMGQKGFNWSMDFADAAKQGAKAFGGG